MNPDLVSAFLKQGFYITLGATTSVVESIQDSQKREENLSQLNLGFDRLSQIWADKGQVTESEARRMIDSMASQYGLHTSSNSNSSSSSSFTSLPAVDPSLLQDLRTLTNQIANMRLELTQMRDQNP
jgi:hypothetical protein